MWREVIATYYAMISRMDAHFGRILAAIERAGAADTTVTAFFADHGEYLGDYGLIEKWPSAMSANITRDPLVIAGPRVPPGVIVDDMVEIIDVFPTLLDLAEILDGSHRHYGRTLRPAIAGQGHRTYAFTEGGFTVEEEPQLERLAFPYDLKGEIQHRDPAWSARPSLSATSGGRTWSGSTRDPSSTTATTIRARGRTSLADPSRRPSRRGSARH